MYIINKRFINVMNLMLDWLEYIFKFSFKNGLLGDSSAILPRLTAYFTVLREKCAHLSYTLSRFKILSNPVCDNI